VSRRSAIPSATYRLQLHKAFTFADALAQLPYLSQLGVSHLYLSPILKARAGSTHGYDVVDPGLINPELGGEAGLRDLARAADAAGLGVILDIVPNHQAVWRADNAAWLDLLENGPASAFAATFDLDPDDDGARTRRVLAPILGKPYGQALADGDITLAWDADLGKLAFAYGPHRLPLRPDHYGLVAGRHSPMTADLSAWSAPQPLHDLLERQHFRLAWWRTAGDAINWRRFFDINELAGVCVEDPAVFEASQAMIFRLYAEGLIDGVRVDHIDGLADPAAYARALRQRLERLNAARPDDAPRDGPWIVVEKILGAGEALPRDWGVDGTTGYDFMDEVSALQHDPAGEALLNQLWREASGRADLFETYNTEARIEILQAAFAGPLARTARAFAQLAAQDLATRDLTEEAFRRALSALIVALRTYRSYATGHPNGPPAGVAFDRARAAVAKRTPGDAPALDFVAATLVGRVFGRADAADAARRLHQLSAPVAAKAVEDTAFYRYSRLLSRNDVGFAAECFSLDREVFLARGAARAEAWPRAMLTTATHDHKRGEDVRARLAVISELPGIWREAVSRWNALNAAARPDVLAAEDDYALYQMMAAAWPVELAPQDAAGLAAFKDRLGGWRLKSLREAKQRTAWTALNDAFEAATERWLGRLLDPVASPEFLSSMAAFAARIAGPGAINGVVQAALRCSWPGVPDLYQGAELWDLSMVDPDNRRAVDFDLRAQLLAQGRGDWVSGALKLATIAKLLACRRQDPDLFTYGGLRAMNLRGARAGHLLAFERHLQSRSLAIAVMLQVAEPVTRLGQLPEADWWSDTEVRIDGVWRLAAYLFERSPVFVGTTSRL
jgi:(1->4)-alpha-D-glucan 1-alpha-D-glucosylmutase